VEYHDRIRVLDGLRALAITLVLLRHSVRAFWPDMTQPFMPVAGTDLGYLFINGWIGVDLFFVLSGFLITNQLLPRPGQERGMDVLTYARHRIFRIVPVYYCILLATCIGLFPYFPYPKSYENIEFRIFYHLLFMQDYWPSDINVVFWTLAIEIKFYLLAPFFLLPLMKIRSYALRIMIVVLCIAAVVGMRTLTALYLREPFVEYETYFLTMRSLFHLSIDGLLIGMLCRIIVGHEHLVSLIYRAPAANIMFFLGLFLVLGISMSGVMVDLGVDTFDKTVQPLLISIGFGLMLLGLLGNCIGSKIFQAKPLYYIALISYSMYLLHLPMLFFVERLFTRFADISLWTKQEYFIFYFPVFFGVTALFSTLTYLFIEKPGIQFGHNLGNKKADKTGKVIKNQ
jgi:peptidoglycan/LPS O-acetylase OafA/YrhL